MPSTTSQHVVLRLDRPLSPPSWTFSVKVKYTPPLPKGVIDMGWCVYYLNRSGVFVLGAP